MKKGGIVHMDIFACSMAKKSSGTIMKKNDDIFACSMAKKSSGTIMKKNDSKITLSTGNERKSA